MDDWSSFRTTTSEQQRLRAALSGFCESQDLPEEQRAAYTAYLRKRIRSAVETLIREDNFSRLETLLQTGWLSDADRKRFLNLAADQQKWQAFHILLNRNSQDPMQENTESRKTEAAVIVRSFFDPGQGFFFSTTVPASPQAAGAVVFRQLAGSTFPD